MTRIGGTTEFNIGLRVAEEGARGVAKVREEARQR